MSAAAVAAASFAAMFAGHQLGDHIFQTDRMATGKAAARGWFWDMFGHLATYHVCVAVALLLVDQTVVSLPGWHVAAAVVWSVLSHGFIDRRWPVRWLLRRAGAAVFADRESPVCGMYLADQSLHIACLFVAALIVGSGVS